MPTAKSKPKKKAKAKAKAKSQDEADADHDPIEDDHDDDEPDSDDCNDGIPDDLRPGGKAAKRPASAKRGPRKKPAAASTRSRKNSDLANGDDKEECKLKVMAMKTLRCNLMVNKCWSMHYCMLHYDEYLCIISRIKPKRRNHLPLNSSASM